MAGESLISIIRQAKNGELGMLVWFRALLEHTDWHVPLPHAARLLSVRAADGELQLPGRVIMIHSEPDAQSDKVCELFTGFDTLDAAIAKYGEKTVGNFVAGIAGYQVFHRLESFSTVHIDNGSEALALQDASLRNIVAFARAIQFERAITDAADSAVASALRGSPETLMVPEWKGAGRILTLENVLPEFPRLAVAFTCPDHWGRLLSRLGASEEQFEMRWVSGQQLIAAVPSWNVDGVFFDRGRVVPAGMLS